MNNPPGASKTRKSLIVEQFQLLACQIADEFQLAREAALPTPALAAEVRQAMAEALEHDVEQPFDTIRFRFAQIFHRRLSELWHR